MTTLSKIRKPAALIYTHSLLEGSMTFIKSHAEALSRFTPIFVGSHRVDGIPLPADRTYTVNDGSALGFVREALFRKLYWAPGFYRNLRKHDPRVVHAHFGDCGPAGMAIADKLGVPLVVTFHGQDATQHPSQAIKSHRGRELMKKKDKLIAHTGAFIAVSNHIQQRLLEQGYPEKKIFVHRNGIDVEFFRPNPAVRKDPVIVFVGRFVEKKGTEYLLEAARALKDSGVKFELAMIGSGPLESSLRATVEATDIPCRFEGFLDVSGVKNWIERASVVAVPSVTAANGDSEGLPTVLLEAQAMATPVVATRHSGIPEGVRAGKTAELVDERDSSALARELRSFLESPEKVRAFGEAGRKFVCDNFDIRSQSRGLEEIYANLISD